MHRRGNLRILLAFLALAVAVVACDGSPSYKPVSMPGSSRQVGAVCSHVVAETKQLVKSSSQKTVKFDLADALSRLSDQVGLYKYQMRRALSPPLAALQRSLAKLGDAYVNRDDVSRNASINAIARQLAAVQTACPKRAVTSLASLPEGASKIKHVIVIMQENRSFDHYFGTFPGADGIPMRDGIPTVCIPNPVIGGCSVPEHHPIAEYDRGGPHTYADSVADIHGGKMDGFVAQWEATRRYCLQGDNAQKPTCLSEATHPDVLSYHDGRDIPNYWEYAKQFVLQDHMFEPNLGWSQPSHLAMVSGWSAVCKSPYVAASCKPSITFNDVDNAWPHAPSYGWTDLTYLLHKYGVKWRYYVAPGSLNDCEGTTDEQIHCTPGAKNFDPIGTPEPWNPLPDFTDVRQDHQVMNVQFNPRFFKAAREGTLPTVSWVVPGWYDSEHPPATVGRGQAWVTRVANAVMKSPNWRSSAIFVAWDDWGGFYDHMVPPRVDKFSYGLRVPAFMISPYARRGMIDHQVLSFDAYLKFIEDRFLGGARIDPYTDGRWDPRPRVAESTAQLGDLMSEFNFRQKPRAPLILPEYPN
jgi:phospholipase C